MLNQKPLLDCPVCGVPLIPALGRGHWEDDNPIDHEDACHCGQCDWWWFDDMSPVRCVCGALVKVECDEEYAYSTEIVDEESEEAAPT